MQLPVSVSRDRFLHLVTVSLFLVFILLLPRFTDQAKNWFYLLCIVAIVFLALHAKEITRLERPLRLLFLLLLANFIWMLASFYINGQPGRGTSFLWNRHVHLLMLIPLYFLFRRVRVSDSIIVVGLFLSLLVSVGDMALDLARGIDHRLQGMNPNAFGPIQLALGGILFFHFLFKPASWEKWLALIGVMLALTAVVLSKSKGTWMALPVLIVFFTFYLPRNWSIAKKSVILAILLGLIASSYLLPIVKTRIDYGIVNIEQYFASDDYRDDSRLGTFGTRAELWRSAWQMFRENPLTGVGVGGFKVTNQLRAEDFAVNEVVKRFKNPHNQYLNALATRGLPGLLLLLGFLCMPIYIALRGNHATGRGRIDASCILLICITYLTGNLVDDHFEGKSAIIFFACMVALLLARLPQTAAITTETA